MRSLVPFLLASLTLPVVTGCGGRAEGEYQAIANVDEPVVVPAEKASDEADPVDDLAGLTDTADEPADSANRADATPADVQPADSNVATDDADPGVIEQVAAVGLAPGVTAPRADDPVDAPSDAATEPRAALAPGESLVPAPEFKRERGGALRVTFDDLDLNRVIGIDKPTETTPAIMPKWQLDLVGRRIRIRGFMKPPFESATDLPAFSLVRDNGVCCFGPMAKMYDKVHVYLREGDTIDLQAAPLDIEGTFDIAPFSQGGDLLLFYVLEDAVVVR